MVEADGYPFQWEDVKNAVTTYEEAWRSGDANAVMDIFTDGGLLSLLGFLFLVIGLSVDR